MLKITEDILDDLKALRKAGKTKREAAKILTNSTLSTFNAAAKRADLELAIREIYPLHRTGPQAKKGHIKAPETAEEALATLSLDLNDIHVKAATMKWRVSVETYAEK